MFPKIRNLLLNFSKLQIYLTLSKIPDLISKVTEISKLDENPTYFYKITEITFRSMLENFKHTNRL